MKAFVRVLGGFILGLGALLCLIGLSTLPDGGLMFALPYVFLMPGLLLCLVGGVMLYYTGSARGTDANGAPSGRDT